MRNTKSKAAVAALITAGAIAVGAATGGLSSTQARRDSKPPPWCGVICMGLGANDGAAQEHALRGRKAGKEQQEYLLAIPGVRGNGQSGGCDSRPC